MFGLMFDKLARPLTIKLPTKSGFDDSGMPLPNKPKVIHVKEPLVTNSNPSITFDNGSGGSYPTNQLVWQSRTINDAPRGAIVEANGHSYKVSAVAHANLSNDTYYQVKEVKGH